MLHFQMQTLTVIRYQNSNWHVVGIYLSILFHLEFMAYEAASKLIHYG